MRLVFLSNYYNHHQKSLCEALFRLTGGSFRFIETQKMSQERKDLGYAEEKRPAYVLQALTDGQREQVRELIDSAEVLLTGTAPEPMLQNRIRSGKIVFRYSERPLKLGNEWWKYPVRYFRWHRFNPTGSRIYMMCASAYTALDYAKFGLFRNKCYKFGYFPPFIEENPELLQREKEQDPLRILWAGRFIDWKHPEAVLEVAETLKQNGIPASIGMIGSGALRDATDRMIRERNLEKYVTIYPSMSTENVRSHMRRSSVFLLTSDFQEGWGTVLNEAMNAGCAVVASHAAGGAPFLLKHRENGMLFESGNWGQLSNLVVELSGNQALRECLGRNAYETIRAEWNAEIAAERFLQLIDRIEAGEDTPFETGPCSRAGVLRNGWFSAED